MSETAREKARRKMVAMFRETVQERNEMFRWRIFDEALLAVAGVAALLRTAGPLEEDECAAVGATLRRAIAEAEEASACWDLDSIRSARNDLRSPESKTEDSARVLTSADGETPKKEDEP